MHAAAWQKECYGAYRDPVVRNVEPLGETGCSEEQNELNEFALPLDRQQMGDVLGLTIETVRRQLSRLKADGVIGLPDRRMVSIRDRRRLQDLSAAA
jgi:CRP/FNR family transcriptional regulator, anaerobic regulatory protein